MTICLTGATGTSAARLAPLLLDAGHALRCLVRDKQARIASVGRATRR